MKPPPISRDTFFSMWWDDCRDVLRGIFLCLAGLDESWALMRWDELPDEHRAALTHELTTRLHAHEQHRREDYEKRKAREPGRAA
jgi:hypothetical protein